MSYEIIEQLRVEAEASQKAKQEWLGKALIAAWALIVVAYILI